MSNYHRILGVSVGASKVEIKKAYRDKAKVLHPDRNPSPSAADRFAVLQEAYDALMNPSQEATNTREARTAQRKQKSPEERAKEARDRYRTHMKREEAKDERYYQSLITGARWKYVNFGTKLCMVIFIALFWDFVLPTHRERDELMQFAAHEEVGFKYKKVRTIFTANYGYAYVAESNYHHLQSYPGLYIEKSRLLHIPTNILHVVNGNVERYPFDKHTWSYMPLPLMILFVPTFLVFYKRRTVYFTGAYMASCYIIIPMTVVFLLRDDRWLHLLTLGFI